MCEASVINCTACKGRNRIKNERHLSILIDIASTPALLVALIAVLECFTEEGYCFDC